MIVVSSSMAKRLVSKDTTATPVLVQKTVADGLPVGETAYRRIRSDIVFGRLCPGQKLTLDRMKEAYDASVSTLREILNRLSSEGLIVAEGARGFEVMPISPDNLRQVASMRLLLERHALKEWFDAGDMEWEGRVVAAFHKLALMEKKWRLAFARRRKSGNATTGNSITHLFPPADLKFCSTRTPRSTTGIYAIR